MDAKKLTLEDQLNAVRVKVNKLRPVAPAQVIDPSARCLDALDRKEDLVCVKAFHSEEGEYQPGQTVDVSNWGLAGVAKLSRYGYLLPAGEYSQSLQYQAAADLYDNVLQPVLSTLQHARQDAQKAGEGVGVAAAALAVARRQAEDAAGQVGLWEDKLADLLKGENVQQLLAG